MDLFKLDPGLAIWTWVSFAILFFLLSRFLFPSLMRSIKDREKVIADAVDNAARIEKRLLAAQDEHDLMIKRARAEATNILRDVRIEAETLRQTLLNKAEKEAQDVMEQNRMKIAEERRRMIGELQSELASLICDGAEKVAGTSFVGDIERKWSFEMAGRL